MICGISLSRGSRDEKDEQYMKMKIIDYMKMQSEANRQRKYSERIGGVKG